MDAWRMVMESRAKDVNPFREMLQRMGAFGSPSPQDLVGANQPGPGPGMGQPQGGGGPVDMGSQIQTLVAQLIAAGVPRDRAVMMAQQMIRQKALGQMTGGASPLEQPPGPGQMGGFAGG